MAVQQWTTSGARSFVVPTGVTSIAVTLVGADGGAPNAVTGGSGASISFTLAVTAGQTYTFDVGGAGGNNGSTSGAGTGGYPSGGDGGDGVVGQNSGGGGGGATRLKLGATILAIAGGGGGGANTTGSAHGGAGGALSATAGVGQGAFGGGGGTQAAGGAAGSVSTGCTAGASNQGGHGANNAVVNGAGGGGDGFFGGGGGGENNATGASASGGGGGSSWLTATGTSGASSTAGTQGGGSAVARNGSATVTYNLPPNSPTLVAPTSGGTIDQSIPTPFSWNFSDPDSGDTQSSADLRWRTGGGAWNNVFAAATTSQSYTAPANTFTGVSGVSVEWQVRTTDSHGSQGPYSTSFFFTPEPEPAAPTMSPTPIINSNAPNVSISTGYTFRGYQMRVVNDVAGAPGATVLVDTGAVSVSPASALTRALPSFGYVNGTAYHVQARTTPYNVSGGATAAWSPWTDSGAITAALGSPPLVPTLVLTTDSLTASISVAITNPGSDPHPPDHNDVYRTDLTHNTPEIRVASGLPLNTVWSDFLPASNVLYRYRVVAVTAAGASSSST